MRDGKRLLFMLISSLIATDRLSHNPRRWVDVALALASLAVLFGLALTWRRARPTRRGD